jgi:hypothetical protein
MKTKKHILSFISLIAFALLFYASGSSTKEITTSVPKVTPKFDFVPPSQAAPASNKMTIAIVRPIFVSKNPEYFVSPFPEMATSMGNDFEELLAAKGFTMRGPFNTRDEMVYNDKVNSSFILEIQIDLKPEYNTEFTTKSQGAGVVSAILLGPSEKIYTIKTNGNITFGGNLVLTASSPQYGEKIWKKNIALEKSTFSYTGTIIWYDRPSIGMELVKDNAVYNIFSAELEKYYIKALDLVWKQIDPLEMKTVTDQAKKADQK